MIATRNRPATRPQRDSYHHGDLAAALKATALRMIGEGGVEAFSLREATTALGVSPSAVYRHFRDKAALLAALSRDAFVELAQRFERGMARADDHAGGDPQLAAVVRFVAQGHAYVQFALEHPARFQVMFGPYGAGTPGGLWLSADGTASPYAMLAGALDALRDAGVVDAAARVDAEVTAWSAIHGLACLLVAGAIKGATRKRAEAMTDQVVSNVLAALRAGPSAAAWPSLLSPARTPATARVRRAPARPRRP